MPPHSPETREGAAAFSYLVCGCLGGVCGLHSQRRFATHFLRADAGNPPSQSSGTLRAHPEGAASPHRTEAGILIRKLRGLLLSQPAHPHDRTRRKFSRHPAQQNEPGSGTPRHAEPSSSRTAAQDPGE